MSIFRGIFGGGNTIESLRADALRQEKRRLEVEEQSLARRIRDSEAKKAKAFADAVRSGGSKVDDRIAARRIHALQSEQNDWESQARDAHGKLMALDRLLRMKERQKQLEERGVWAKISKMDIDELNEALLSTNVHDREQRDLVDLINDTLGIDDATLAAEESPVIGNILEHIEAARESGMVEDELSSLDRQESHRISER